MANQITINRKNLQDLITKVRMLQAPMNRATAKRVADATVAGMLKEVARERSPVRGFGKYEALSDLYAAFKRRHTGRDTADLDLTGAMLDSLRGSAVKSGKGWVARIDFSSSRSRELEEFHRTSIPPRPLIPEPDEGFSEPISRLVRDILTNRVRRILTL